jgi:alcohol dehydrogenase
MKFHLPTRIVFGAGSVSDIQDLIKEFKAPEKVYVVTDKGVRQAGITDSVTSVLPVADIFDEVEPNPRHTTIDRAAGRIRELKPDVIIGVGGGSVLDAAKAVALLGTNPGGIEDYEGMYQYKNPPLPMVAVPTTCGTGSEVTWSSVITHTERRFKMTIKGPHTYPVLAVLDPDLLATLPANLASATGMDALVHAIEAYTVKPATFMTDLFALESCDLIFRYIERVHKDIRNDAEARGNMMKASMLAGMAFSNSDVGAVHCLSEALGALYDIPHGVANAAFLPYVMEFNLPQVAGKYADIARRAGIKQDDDKTAGQELIALIKDLSRRLEIPSVQNLGVQKGQFLEIARKSYQNNSNPSNPREAGIDDYLHIIYQALQS